MNEESEVGYPEECWDWDAPDACDGKPWRLLNPALVDPAVSEEMELMRRIGFFEEVPVEECWREIGRAPIRTK